MDFILISYMQFQHTFTIRFVVYPQSQGYSFQQDVLLQDFSFPSSFTIIDISRDFHSNVKILHFQREKTQTQFSMSSTWQKWGRKTPLSQDEISSRTRRSEGQTSALTVWGGGIVRDQSQKQGLNKLRKWIKVN